jgi:hypothetical protein
MRILPLATVLSASIALAQEKVIFEVDVVMTQFASDAFFADSSAPD